MAQADSHHSRTAPSKSSPGKPRPASAPNVMPACFEGKEPITTLYVPIPLDPQAYGLIVTGNCMAPAIQNGDHVICSPNTKVTRGMIAAFFFKNRTEAKLKRLTTDLFKPATADSNCQLLITVEMDNPPEQFYFDPCTLDKVHAVVGVVRAGQFIAINAQVAQ